MDIPPEVMKEMEDILFAPRGKKPKRKPTARIPKLPTIPRPDPAAKRAMNALARKLTSGPPEERRMWVAAALATHPTSVMVALVDSLLAALLRPREPAGRDALVDTLGEFGTYAADAVSIAIVRTRLGWQQAALAKVCAKLGPTLSARERGQLGHHLLSVSSEVPEPEAVDAIASAIAVLRPASESSSRR